MAQLSQLLLFDPDPSGLDTLTYGFEREGCSVTGTSDLAKARLLIQEGSSPLVVVNLRNSEQPALELIRTTTMNPRTRNLACVAIGQDAYRSAAVAAGAFVFLSVPLFLRDIIGVCRMVAAASVPGSRPSLDAELSLSLTDVDGIYFLVRAMAVTGRSAVVEVRHDPSRGELRFIHGALTSAEVASVQGLPALHRMLLWEDATLHFKFKNVVRRGAQLSMKSNELLEECDRFLRDFSHEARELGFARTCYAADLDRMQRSAALPSEVVPVLKLFDGQRDLARILEESPFRIFDTLKIVKRFVTDGAIKMKGSTPLPVGEVPAGISGPGALDVWLQKKSPALGPEVGGNRNAQRDAQTVHNGASHVAFTAGGAADAIAGTGAKDGGDDPARIVSPFVVIGGAGGAANSGKGVVGRDRKRTTTKKNGTEAPNSVENAITPSPVRRLTESPTKSNTAMARGEIRISAVVPRIHESVPPAGALSVMIEPTVLPAAVPMTSTAPPPVTAQVAPPSVIIAPMTVILDPMASIPTPAATPALVPPHRKPESHLRTAADNFNDVEADFFEREADLYKRESVESFDDLDGTNRPNGTPRKR